MVPSWWSVRERLAVRLGRRWWPAWYIAPRASRDRWARMAALMESDRDSVGARIDLLREYGIHLDGPVGPT